MPGLPLKPLLSSIIIVLTLNACSINRPQTVIVETPLTAEQIIQQNPDNPFFAPYNTVYQIPDFANITSEDYLPAFEAGIAELQQQISLIANNKQAPTFANTIEAIEFSGDLLSKVTHVFFNLTSADTSNTLQTISKKIAPKLSGSKDDIYLNDTLFQRVKTVYDQKDTLLLNTAETKLLQDTYLAFTRGGANLSTEDKNKLRELNEKISKLNLTFGNNLLAETNDFELILNKPEQLSGLPQDVIDTAARKATRLGYPGKWVFTTNRPSITPFLTYADNRQLRETIFNAYISKANHDNKYDNKVILAEIAALRADLAKLMGYQSYAHFVLEERTAQTPENVYKLLNKIWPAALSKAKSEVSDMQALVDAQGADITIQPWDWWYYSDKIRVTKYSFNEEQTKPYFSLESTLKGVFYTANRLYGISLKERDDLPKYHPDVRTWEVYDKDGSLLAVFMGDYFVRQSKRSGAWMNVYRQQYNMNGVKSMPIVVNVLNYPRPAGNEPALLTFEQAKTLFHEFGHALHGMLSDVTYRSQSGTAVPRDYVEFPSQVMENWMTQPEVLAQFARHYQTGEVIPHSLIEKIQDASKFNQGFYTVEYMAATYLDLDWHSLEDSTIRDAAEFEAASLNKMVLINEIAPRYRSSYFSHIFAGRYSAGYYSYLWADILGVDAFEAFKENGIFDPKTAQSFRDNILSKGGSNDPMTLYRQFRGKEPEIEPLLRSRGFLK